MVFPFFSAVKRNNDKCHFAQANGKSSAAFSEFCQHCVRLMEAAYGWHGPKLWTGITSPVVTNQFEYGPIYTLLCHITQKKHKPRDLTLA